MKSLEIHLSNATNHGNHSPTTVTVSSVTAASIPEALAKISKNNMMIQYDRIRIVMGGDDGSNFAATDLAGLPLAEHTIPPSQVEILVESFSTNNSNSNNRLETIHTAFFLAGMQCISESKTEHNQRVLVAHKKNATNTAASSSSQSSSAGAVVSIVKLDDDNLIDEDALLGQEDMAPDMKGISAADPSKTDDCGGREPCDNCTCGRASGATDDNDNTKKTVPSSSCGKCGLGDAFRCPTCPYLGLPAFKPGEEHLVLQLKDDL